MNQLNNITLLRNLMKAENIDAVILSGTDPHLSEYTSNKWRTIEWISGFTGSYAKVVVTGTKAVLWTDSRYFIQAESQLKGSEFMMLKDRQPDSVSIEDWLKLELKPGSVVAIDGLTISAANANTTKQKLNENGIELSIKQDLISPIWNERPVLLPTPVNDYSKHFAGQSRSEKISKIRNNLIEKNSNAILICQLDDVAWSLNLRGNEIKFNPLFTAYAYIDLQLAILFVNKERLNETLKHQLSLEGIQIADYESVFNFPEKNFPEAICLDPERTNSVIYHYFAEKCRVIEGISIPTLLKSVKNKVEISGMRAAHRRDGVAMVNFLYWFDKNKGKEKMTELSLSEKLRGFRSEQKYFRDESFSPIVGFGSHGAIVHYSASPETDKPITQDGILLIDSGGQYLDGTTDITRTIATGKVNTTRKTDFTIVLKAMINLAKAKFPENTKGHSLDIISRKELWDKCLNYGHGTGHGVGHYLSVHEGPMSIRAEYNAMTIKPGQILTDEPGLYREGKYGIRIENVLVCRNDIESEFGKFLSFETLSLCPIDKKLILKSLLNKDELIWLNNYHKKVLRALKPSLKPEVLKWLITQCEPI